MAQIHGTRTKAPGEHVDLAGAVIPYTDLSDTNLASANLDGTTLSHADLSGTDLSGASLVGAVLANANLSNTNLSHADLTQADLKAANLFSTDFTNANLDRANLRQARLHGANLSHATNVSWCQLLEAYIGDGTSLPEDLAIEALHDALEVIFKGFDLRVEFREVYDNGSKFLLKLQELAGERTIREFGIAASLGRVQEELASERSSAGLSDGMTEYKDE